MTSLQTDMVVHMMQTPDVSRIKSQMSEAARIDALDHDAKLAIGQQFNNALGQIPTTDTPDQIDAKAVKEKPPETLQKFEAMIMEQFAQYMMPKQSEEVFGKGIAGDMWKSMMAQHIGQAIAKGGGLGIAEDMMRANKAISATGPIPDLIKAHPISDAVKSDVLIPKDRSE